MLEFASTLSCDGWTIEPKDSSTCTPLKSAFWQFSCHQNKKLYWGDNDHATWIDSGPYLWQCLIYVELNMVPCRVVAHPSGWDWVGYHEIMGHRRRYRLLDLDRLVWRLGYSHLEDMRRHFEAGLLEAMARDGLKRQGAWTEALAVGSRAFVEEAQGRIQTSRTTEIIAQENDRWVLKEIPVPYTAKTRPK